MLCLLMSVDDVVLVIIFDWFFLYEIKYDIVLLVEFEGNIF